MLGFQRKILFKVSCAQKVVFKKCSCVDPRLIQKLLDRFTKPVLQASCLKICFFLLKRVNPLLAKMFSKVLKSTFFNQSVGPIKGRNRKVEVQDEYYHTNDNFEIKAMDIGSGVETWQLLKDVSKLISFERCSSSTA